MESVSFFMASITVNEKTINVDKSYLARWAKSLLGTLMIKFFTYQEDEDHFEDEYKDIMEIYRLTTDNTDEEFNNVMNDFLDVMANPTKKEGFLDEIEEINRKANTSQSPKDLYI
jgi:hypothetical protein